MNVGVGIIAAFALAVGAWLYYHREAPRFTVFLALIAGLGIGGALGGLIGGVIRGAVGAAGSTTSAWMGVSASAIVAGIALVATLEVLVKGLGIRLGKKSGTKNAGGGGFGGKSAGGATTKRWHPILALVLPTIVIAGGLPLLSLVMGTLATGIGHAGTALTSIGG